MKRLASFTMTAVLLLACLILAACGGGKPAPATSAPAATAPAAQKPAANDPAKAAQPAGPTAAAAAAPTRAPEKAAQATTAPKQATAVPAQEETLSLSSRDQGLDKLKSYRMVWKSNWSGTDSSGKAETTNWDWTEEFSSNPQGLHWIWKTADAGAQAKNNQMEFWQLGNTTYMMTYDDAGKGSCMSFSSEDQNSQLTKGVFSPNMLGSLNGAKYAGTDTINGIKARHYTYDEKSGALMGWGKVTGETWVAVDGGYVVKDVMNWEGSAGLLGAGGSGSGKGNWTWELSNVDQPLALKAPENCGGAATGLPVLPDATEKSTFGDMTSYKTKTAIKDAVAFYAKEMAAAGWAPSGEPTTMEDVAMLSFTKGGEEAGITITRDNDTTQVLINVTKK